jgi:hypothetical protein
MRESGLRPQFGIANHLILIVCFICQEKWASWKKSNHLRPIYLKH